MNGSTIDKLVILFVFDKMEMPLTEDSLLEICCNHNDWMLYIDCKECLAQLTDAGLLCFSPNSPNDKPLYTLTQDGGKCLSEFYTSIPSHLRDTIASFVKQNRLYYRRKQEYFSDYYKNVDGSYSVILKIFDGNTTIMDMKLVVGNRHDAKAIFRSWESRASQIYGTIYETLMD